MSVNNTAPYSGFLYSRLIYCCCAAAERICCIVGHVAKGKTKRVKGTAHGTSAQRSFRRDVVWHGSWGWEGTLLLCSSIPVLAQLTAVRFFFSFCVSWGQTTIRCKSHQSATVLQYQVLTCSHSCLLIRVVRGKVNVQSRAR